MDWARRLLRKQTMPQPGITPFIACQQKGGDGLACIAMLFAYHGINVSCSHLHDSYRRFNKSIGLSDIIEVLATHGLMSQPLHCKLKELTELSLPAILYWSTSEFAVLAKIKGEQYIVFVPSSGKLTLGEDEFCRHFSEIALQIYAPVSPDEFQPGKTFR